MQAVAQNEFLPMEKTRTILIKVATHRKTGLMFAESDDLPGLMVPGRTYDELEARIPTSVRDLLEAAGEEVGAIVLDEVPPGDFVPPTFSARLEIRAH